MRFKLASEDDGRTFVLILEQGEEAFAAIMAFANEKAINAASVTAIGAFEAPRSGGSTSPPSGTIRFPSTNNAKY
jgi:predicted DNA-binding protein with PD1-like motif